MAVTWELVSSQRLPAPCATASLSGVLAHDDVERIRTTVTTALAEERSLLLDVAGLRLCSPAVVAVFADALVAAGGWPAARLVLVDPPTRVEAALAATGVACEVPVVANARSGRARLRTMPDRVTRRLRLRAGRSASRRARSFVVQAGSAWCVEGSLQDDAVAVVAELVRGARAAGVLTVSLDRSGLYVALRDFGPVGPHPPSTTLATAIARGADVGVVPRSDGKVVWALLPAEQRPAEQRVER